jgi:hypothetical protein
MPRFLISFNDGDMQVADHEWQQVADESHAVVREAEAYAWAAKIAKGCRCAQEVREFIDDPESVN